MGQYSTETQYILERPESIAVACGAAGWIWRHQSLLLPHFRSNVVTRDDIERFQQLKKKFLKGKLGEIFLSAQSFYLTLTKRSFNRHF